MASDITTGSSTLAILANNAQNLERTRQNRLNTINQGLSNTLNALNAAYLQRRQEKQQDLDNAYRADAFNHQKEVFEHQKDLQNRNFDFQQQQENTRNKQWKQEFNQRAALQNEQLRNIKLQNDFLKSTQDYAKSDYNSNQPQAQQQDKPTFFFTQPQEQPQDQAQQSGQNQHILYTNQPQPNQDQNTQAKDQPQSHNIRDFLKFKSAFRSPVKETEKELILKSQNENAKSDENNTKIFNNENIQQHNKTDKSISNTHNITQQPTQNNLSQHNHTANSNKPKSPLNYFLQKNQAGESLNEVDYLHLQALGLKPTGMGNINLDANLKSNIKINKERQLKINDSLKSLDSTFSLMLDTEKNADFLNAAARIAHNYTAGFTPLTGDLARYNARDLDNTKAIAQAQAAGKATNQDKQDAKEIYSTRFRSPQEQVNTLSGAVESTIYTLDESIRNANAYGNVPDKVYQAREKAINVRDYLFDLQRKKRKVDYNKLNRMITEYKAVLEDLNKAGAY